MFSVIFDMDGTLLDTQRICIPAWDYAGKQQGFKNMGKCIPEVCGMNTSGSNNYLIERFPSLLVDKFKDDARKYILEQGKIIFKSGAYTLLCFLKENNIKVALASGTSRGSVEHHLNEVGIYDVFDVIACGNDVAKGKPAPDIFLYTAKQLGVKPENCFVLEDSANGIKAGFAAGMKCIGVPDIVPFDIETKKLMLAELKSLDEAIDLLKRYI